MSDVDVRIGGDWTATELVLQGARRRRGDDDVDADELIPSALLTPAGLEIAAAHELTLAPRRGVADDAAVDLTVAGKAGEHYVLALRHASGALSFHRAEPSGARRRAGAQAREWHFHVALDDGTATPARRGVISGWIRTIVLKVAGKVADPVLAGAARKWEQGRWRQRGLREGVFRIDASALAGGALQKARAADFGPKDARCLLLIHGTFSNAADSFGSLIANDAAAFEALAARYDGRVFAFNHFSVSKTPAENAAALLAALPARRHEYDVVTHSRGALVLRTLNEGGAGVADAGKKFRLRRAVLVAAPNNGTPLATPARWENMVSWLANITELLPPGPWSLTVDFISTAVSWLAQRIPGAVPGIAAMDVDGDVVRDLQGPPHAPAPSYAALASNYAPTENLLKRALDVGVDSFFAEPNDLVVPTAGGWAIDNGITSTLPADQIGCFGPGGNLTSSVNPQVWHTDFFIEPAARRFLLQMLPNDLRDSVPDRRAGNRSADSAQMSEPLRVQLPGLGAPAATSIDAVTPTRVALPTALTPSAFTVGDVVGRPPLSLTILDAGNNSSVLFAQYGNAKVVEPFRTRGQTKNAGERFRRIIRMHERIIGYVNGKAGGSLPSDAELVDYGAVLFETLFPGDVRRLYDVVRSLHAREPLDVILTSMTPWIADKPWEFAYDPARKTFLATEEIHFTRNVVTAVPAENVPEKSALLQILVVAASPIGTGRLSVAEETRVLRQGFEPLIDAGLADVDVITGATAGRLHERVLSGHYDVVHFIGHGEYDADSDQGFLLFEDAHGGVQHVGHRELREILCRRSIRLVFFNACETGRGGRADFNRGVAPALVAGGVPTVVANQYSVLDVSATVFARSLYWSLARGESIGTAVKEARVCVNYSISGESIDWAVPVVYTRNPQERLCSGVSVPPADYSHYHAGRARRGAVRRDVQIGVWDINHQFPDIEALLEEMNAAQSKFGFQVVYVTAPLGAIATTMDEGTATRYLNAEEVSRRLRNQPTELGVDYLCCITDQYMMDSQWYNLYGWWDYAAAESAIIFFSMAGFELAGRPDVARQVLAKELATTVTHVRADLGTHRRGPKSCPFYFNEERNVELLKNAARFDRQCRREIREKLSAEELAAVEAIYKKFSEPSSR